MLSDRLRIAVRMADERQYRLARRAGLDPSIVSKWLNGIVDPKRGDPRVVKLGALVGVPADACFDNSDGSQP